ncbi:iron-siderophore ABC transporter substrate-binding protein [Halalkalibacterium halodurans]|uniref:ABC transporter substrate-binding protein n=1 Tax=Halalkalibacterium halodurans TaxID=86665 RepID=UPI002E21A97A|nr:iron-siderophore ABC transporter substrate-binding protein [Halalkalibacterium halodurans]MED4084223.1 iron-siderophore ABC transporter substrate-binding protein [Halalkalibacterium halodurans]MED4104700.1 iron-siderophore ABC transporter substrate-binding protein [Halalkalibacterium halodurans]MED4108429.1 iron-siderophore ABC transporter substrate-binding protein [Halalkalibacterium halodurans]MED4147450.1 iron-siderophore ABC transporter substrate-binding protein [Halalkalibacterium halod
MAFTTYLRQRVHSKAVLLLSALLLALLAACGGEATEGEGEEQPEATETTEESGVREVSHAMGVTTIEGKPERIVTLYQGATDAAVAFGMTPVGVVESWLEPPMYEYLRDDLEGVEFVGQETQPNLEEIAKLQPDLIIASQLRHEEVYDQLSEIAPTVVHETVFEFKETVELMGEAMDEEEKAADILAAWDERVEDFKTKVVEKMGDEWPVEVSVLNFREDHARIYATGFSAIILEDLGFEFPENQKNSDEIFMLTDMESIPEMNADVFYMFMSDDETVQKTYEEWTSHPLWENLDAVKADQVYMVDEIAWNMGGGINAANLMLDDIYDRFELEK